MSHNRFVRVDKTMIIEYVHLEERLKPHLDAGQIAVVRRAYDLAAAAHSGQTRDEGSPYIVHPLRVAVSLVEEVGIISPTLICAALLHDVIEDSATTREDIARAFGDEVATIVWLLTKFDDTGLGEYLAEIEAAADIGAPLVKLCDRLDNLRYLVQSPKLEKKRRYIRATEQYYLPLARRSSDYLYKEMRRALDRVIEHVTSFDSAAT
ncbi:MAG TPA: HD domain-containing protein [Blastocatellia bacterium]|nr:HD domain-containing protein [Blastocatellia bacterium]